MSRGSSHASLRLNLTCDAGFNGRVVSGVGNLSVQQGLDNETEVERESLTVCSTTKSI